MNALSYSLYTETISNAYKHYYINKSPKFSEKKLKIKRCLVPTYKFPMKYKNSSKPKIEIKAAKQFSQTYIGTCLKVLTKRTAKFGATIMHEKVISDNYKYN